MASSSTAGGAGGVADTSALLHGLLHHDEGRALWDSLVAPLVGRFGSAALASVCRAGRDYRRARAEGDARS